MDMDVPPQLGESDVRLRLNRQDDSYYTMFTASADNLVVAARLLVDIISDGADREATTEKLHACEHTGDEHTHAILRRLNISKATPFAREDIYRLASCMDDVLDSMEAAGDLIGLYQLEQLPKGIVDQVEVLERAAELTANAMARLHEVSDLSDFWIEINRLENQADRIYRRLLAHLFNGSYDALMVLKLKDVIEELESAADAFENVANTVESIALKQG